MSTQAAVLVPEPLVGDFPAQDQEDAHGAWIRAELTRRMNIQEDVYPHEQVMAEIKAMIESKRKSA